MSDEMSAEPISIGEAVAYQQARAMAIAEAARVARERVQRSFLTDDVYMEGFYDAAEEIANAIRALSSPPSVTEEWIRQRAREGLDSPNGAANPQDDCENAVRATLAALGVTVEGAAK